MTRRSVSRGLVIAAGALAVCAVLALRQTAQEAIGQTVNPRLRDVGFARDVLWFLLYYPMWAALTPLIFFLGRQVRFRRERWIPPLAFHTAASVVFAVAAPVSLAVLFGGVVLGRGYPDLAELLTPFWVTYAAYRAVADSSLYWLILAAGYVLRTYDESQARRLQAADLERSLVAAQVDVLKMKLQPHFLFNALNSIRFLALEKDQPGVVTMVERLANLLRASMSSGNQLVTLDEEMALVDEYLAVEQMRIGERLRVERRIDPAVAKADKTAVAQVVRDVLDALVTGDAARVERLVHPEAAWRTFRVSPPTGKFFLMEGNRDGILAAVRAKAVPPLPNPTVTVLDVYDNIASALTTTPAGSFYWHLARQNNQWRAVNFLRR